MKFDHFDKFQINFVTFLSGFFCDSEKFVQRNVKNNRPHVIPC